MCSGNQKLWKKNIWTLLHSNSTSSFYSWKHSVAASKLAFEWCWVCSNKSALFAQPVSDSLSLFTFLTHQSSSSPRKKSHPNNHDKQFFQGWKALNLEFLPWFLISANSFLFELFSISFLCFAIIFSDLSAKLKRSVCQEGRFLTVCWLNCVLSLNFDKSIRSNIKRCGFAPLFSIEHAWCSIQSAIV